MSRACTTCGAEVPAHRSVCPVCSSIQPAEAALATDATAVPRTVIRPGAPGTPLVDAGPAVEVGAGPQTAPSAPPPPKIRDTATVTHHRLPYLLVVLAVVIVAAIAAFALL